MALFKKKDNQSVLPDEVNEYYESQRRERTGVAIILGIVALIVTLIIGLALFFGGRYIYNQITDDNDSSQVETESTDGTISEEGASIDGEGGNSSNVSDDGTSDDSTSTNDSSDDTSDFGNIDLDGGEGSADTQPTTGDEESIPNTGDNQQALPATGDPGQ